MSMTRHFEGICGTGNPPITRGRGADGTANDEPRQPADSQGVCIRVARALPLFSGRTCKNWPDFKM